MDDPSETGFVLDGSRPHRRILRRPELIWISEEALGLRMQLKLAAQFSVGNIQPNGY